MVEMNADCVNDLIFVVLHRIDSHSCFFFSLVGIGKCIYDSSLDKADIFCELKLQNKW